MHDGEAMIPRDFHLGNNINDARCGSHCSTCTRMPLRYDSPVRSFWQAAFAFSAVIMVVKSRVFEIQALDQELGVWIIERYRAEAGKASTWNSKLSKYHPSCPVPGAETVQTRISFPDSTTASVHHGRTSQFAPGASHVHAQSLAYTIDLD